MKKKRVVSAVIVGLFVLVGLLVGMFCIRRRGIQDSDAAGTVAANHNTAQSSEEPTATTDQAKIVSDSQGAETDVEQIDIYRSDGFESLKDLAKRSDHSRVKVCFVDLHPADIPRVAEYAQFLSKCYSVLIEFDDMLVTDDDLARLAQLRDIQSIRGIWIGSVKAAKGEISDRGIPQLLRFKHLKTIQILYGPITDEGLRRLAALPELRNLILCYMPGITGAGFRDLRDLPIRRLLLEGTNVDDDALGEIGKLQNLEYLVLTKTRILGRGLSSLQNVASLHTLVLNKTRLNDDGMRYVSQLKQLHLLAVAACPITDASIEYLEKLSNLEELIIGETGITDAGIARLHNTLPNVNIH